MESAERHLKNGGSVSWFIALVLAAALYSATPLYGEQMLPLLDVENVRVDETAFTMFLERRVQV